MMMPSVMPGYRSNFTLEMVIFRISKVGLTSISGRSMRSGMTSRPVSGSPPAGDRGLANNGPSRWILRNNPRRGRVIEVGKVADLRSLAEIAARRSAVTVRSCPVAQDERAEALTRRTDGSALHQRRGPVLPDHGSRAPVRIAVVGVVRPKSVRGRSHTLAAARCALRDWGFLRTFRDEKAEPNSCSARSSDEDDYEEEIPERFALSSTVRRPPACETFGVVFA